MSDDRDATRDGLKGASDGLLVAIQEVELRDRKKRGVPSTDPGFPDLAREVRIAAEAVLELARDEEIEANAIASGRADAALPTIEASPPVQSLAEILAEWRDVERRLESVEPTSPEAARLMDEFAALRDRYQEAMKAFRP